VKGVERLSQMTVLLYLTDGHTGGETRFHPTGVVDEERSIAVAPVRGAALCFWHGKHPLSPLHEGAPLLAAAPNASCDPHPKLVIRTEVMYATEAAPTLSESWAPSSYARAMAKLRAMEG
jgi:hypothetical protein